jgi:SAM-dependent methyltransferase
MSASLAAPLLACAAGHTPPNVALMQLLAAAPDEAAARRALATAQASARETGAQRRLSKLRRHWEKDAPAFKLVKEITNVATSGERTQWPAIFNQAADISPEAAVALYTLGNPSLLAAATKELTNQLRAWDLLRPDSCVLDLGCGFGRVSHAIAAHVRSVVAVEVSERMAELGRTRLREQENVLVIRSGGNDLSFLSDRGFDVVLAIDSFPYLVDSGFAERHMAEFMRLLKPAGRLLIMNYSYRGDLTLDRWEVAQSATRYGFAIERNGTADLSLWDGRAFLLRRI